MAKPIQEALELVKSTQEQVSKILSGPKYNGNLLEINSNFKRIQSRLVFMGGVIDADPAKSTDQKFPPIKNFMGRNVGETKADLKETLTPGEASKKAFLAKVDKLWDQIETLTPQNIIANYRIPEDILVVRGVAKRAEVENYQMRDLDLPFVEEIMIAVEMKKEAMAKQAEIDKTAKADKKGGTDEVKKVK